MKILTYSGLFIKIAFRHKDNYADANLSFCLSCNLLLLRVLITFILNFQSMNYSFFYKKSYLPIIICVLHVTTVLAQVKVWEEPVVIPTLKVGQLSEHPTFKAEIDMRADDDQIYPYVYNYKITNEYEDRSYKGCYLENEYIKVLVTPEIGGKLYGAVDKTNGYNFFYWQPTVKPALISLTGPWVSGGIEWCFPSGHRQTGFQEIGYRLTENSDGSKTIWVGETEWVHGLRWLVGLTAYPGKSLLEAKVRLMNPENMPESQYMWAVAATHADSSYQLIYPTEQMTDHNRASFTNWPISKGNDISWWKNIANASSYFAEDIGSFFGGYNHNQEAGTAFVGNKHLMTGKKFWSWGASPSGRLWDWVLSDGGGPYVEPQAGFYTDNQPDFHWLNPGEIRDFSLYFFPVKGIGAFKKANINGALNLEVNGDSIQLGVYSTSKITNAIIRLNYQNKIVEERIISIDPSAPYLQSVPYNKEVQNDFNLSLLDASGKTLISYSPTPEKNNQLPESVEPIKSPLNYGHKDEIWNLGEYLYRNRDKSRAEEFFSVLLEDDSLDIRANISMAQMSIEKAEFEKALYLLNNAHARNRDNGKIYYLRGVANLYLGNLDDAYNAFYRATHYLEFVASGYHQIAQIDLMNGDVTSAETHIEKALERNAKSPDLLTLRAICNRLKQNYEEAEEAISLALEFDPMNLCALNEKIKILELLKQPTFEDQKILKQLLIDDYHYYIQLCLSYIEVGLYEDALEVLRRFPATILEEKTLLEYYKGYCYYKLNDKKAAEQSFSNARISSIDKILPFRKQSIDVLKTALKFEALDFNANYFLGLTYAGLLNGKNAYRNLLKASEINPNQAKVWRNLGYLKYGYPGISKDLALARKYYEKAFELAPHDDLILMEFDKVKMDLKEDAFDRLRFLKKHAKIVETNDNLLATMLDLMVAFGEFETPLRFYTEHFFNNREGKYGIHNSYMSAYIGLAQKEKNPEKALDFYKKACEYPDNLKVKPRNPNLRGFLYYPMALLYREIGNEIETKRLLQITADEQTLIPTVANYYKAQAAREMDADRSKYQQIIAELETEGTKLINGKKDGYIGKDEDFLQALGHYYISLSYQFKGEKKLGESEFEKARDILLTIEQDAIKLAQEKFK